MSLKDDESAEGTWILQQNIQLELDFSSVLTGEAREAGRKALNRPRRRMRPKTQPAPID
jgi:hypothetical protein